MAFKISSNITDINFNSWSRFIDDHPNGNIFQTPEMYKAYKNTPNYEPVLVSVIDEKDGILGIMLAVIQKEYPGFLGALSARSIIFGGPVIKNNSIEVLDCILKEYNKIIKDKAIYSQFRNLWDWKISKDIFKKNGNKYEEHLNILIDLNKSKDELWKDVFSKRRNEIRRAQKEGTTFSLKNTIHDLDECYTILESVYKRAKLPLPDYKFFETLFSNTNNRVGAKLFCAEYEDKTIGCMLALVYKNTIYDFYAGANSKYYNKYPNDLIPWEIFLWGKENGYSLFDFGGAGKPNISYGVRDYKKKFGGSFVNFGRFEIVHKPVLLKIVKFGYQFWREIKK